MKINNFSSCQVLFRRITIILLLDASFICPHFIRIFYQDNMKDVEGMSKEEKHWYIFEDKSFENRPRVKWITDCLLGDIRTFLYGIENRIKEKHAGKAFSDGFGNLSVPVLISTALEFVAALYTGKTKYMEFETKNKFEKDLMKGKSQKNYEKNSIIENFHSPRNIKLKKEKKKDGK